MENFHSRNSNLYPPPTKINQKRTRTHNSEIIGLQKKRPISSVSGRRMFLYKGSQNQKIIASPLSKQPSQQKHIVTNSRQTSVSNKPAHLSRAKSQSRLPSFDAGSILQSNHIRSRSKSTVRSRKAHAAEPVLHSSSAVASSVKSRHSSTPNIPTPNKGDNNPSKPTVSILMTKESTPEVEHTDERKSVSEKIDSKHFDQTAALIQAEDALPADSLPKSHRVHVVLRRSPSLIVHRKIIFDENAQKWVEYKKFIESEKRVLERKHERERKKKVKNSSRAEPHKVRGRTTTRIQTLFPTALIRTNKDNFENITVTDPLRIELYKRRAPLVPTYFQQHIIKFGKLPFRNNPRPHPIV